MLIQIHMLQNFAPSNLNRDDTGSPKDAIFGGKRRGRISSQCLKRSIRRSEIFEQYFRSAGLLGSRTKLLPELIKDELKKMEIEAGITDAIIEKVQLLGRESKKKTEDEEDEAESTEAVEEVEAETKQLIFVSPNEVLPLAERLLELYNKAGAKNWAKLKSADLAKDLKPVMPKSVDIAMFGRMTTSSAFKDVEAAVQVAHALSTNALNEEFDYFTAVDDISGKAGAGMIGDVEYNSSTYYKYLNIHWDGLVKNLGGDTVMAKQAVEALLEASAKSYPSGKQNTFAAFNPPDFILVEVSDNNLPVSYANAFIKPVEAGYDQTLMQASITSFTEYIGKISKMYDLSPSRAYIAHTDLNLPEAQNVQSLKGLVSWLGQQVPVKE